MLDEELEQHIEKADSYKPTQAMVNNAKRGLAARQKAPKSQKGGFDAKEAKAAGVGSGVARARDIINGSLSLESVKRMYSFLSRAETYYKPSERTASGNLTPGTQAFLQWGGKAGLSWSRNILRQEGIIKSVQPMPSEELAEELGVQITKSTNQDKMQATFVVLAPDEVDLHGDTVSEEEVEKACFNFNKSKTATANLFHVTQTNSFEFLQNFVAPTDFILDDRLIKKGTWLCTIQVKDTKLWELIKAGEICSVSIGALGRCQSLEQDEE